MNNDQNVRIVQEAYHCFGTGDLPGLLSLFTDDIEWVSAEMRNVPQSGTHLGKEGATNFFSTLASVQDTEVFEPRHFVANDDAVVAMGNYRFKVKDTGKTFDCDFAHCFTVRDGKIARFQEYTDTAGIVEAFTPDSN